MRTQPDSLTPDRHWGSFTLLICICLLVAGALEWAVWVGTVLAAGTRPTYPLHVWWVQALLSVAGLWGMAALLAPALVWALRRARAERVGNLRFIARHLVILAALVLVHSLMRQAWVAAVLNGQALGPIALARGTPAAVARFIPTALLNFFVVAGAVSAWEYYQRYREGARAAAALELERAHLKASLSEARLEALQAQLQPHFLFNALNSATVLTTADPARASRVLLKLSELLRFTLDRAAPHEVSLRQELAQLEPYLEIQQIRFGARLAIAREVDQGTLDALVPTLVLQPLVENAVRHGIEPNPAGGKVTIRSRATNGTLYLEVRDSGAGPPSDHNGPEGIGLANTRARLTRLYGASHRFELAPIPTGGAAVQIHIPLRRATPAAAGPP